MPYPRSSAARERRAIWTLALALSLSAACKVDEEAEGSTPAPTSEAEAEAAPQVDETPPVTQVLVPNFASVAKAVGPSVVSVISTVETETGRMHGIGSGMVLSVRGEILTNEHVIRGARSVKVLLADDSEFEAELVVGDPLFDLAVLQLQGEVPELQPVRFRDAERPPLPGEWIMAIGQPFGLGDTVTVGVISGLGRDHADLGRPPDLHPSGCWSFIQTDASINVGNSGGPLVDLDGRVLGITTAVREDGQGLAFAIPSEMALAFVDEVHTHGRMRHTRLGIDARDSADSGELPSVVKITRVELDGPGDDASLAVDDLIVAVDGKRVSRVSEVAYLTQLAGVGAEVPLTITRASSGREEQVVIVPGLAGSE